MFNSVNGEDWHLHEGSPVTGAGAALTVTNDFAGSPQRYFRLQLVN